MKYRRILEMLGITPAKRVLRHCTESVMPLMGAPRKGVVLCSGIRGKVSLYRAAIEF